MIKALSLAALTALALAAGNAASAAAPAASAPAAVSATKKQLVAQLLKLQQGGIEAMARTMAQQPAMQVMQQANMALQQMPAERREAVARDIEADIRKYVEEASPIVQADALKLAPTTIGPLLEERFSEDELRQIIAMLESPVNRKFQSMAPDMQKAISEKLVADTKDQVNAKVRAMQQSVVKRLQAPAPAAAPTASAPKAGAKT